jgi:UDP-N-acetyl-D-galactosamine dehydrogenase
LDTPRIAVIGLGYVGLPIALAFAKKLRVVAFDINEHRVQSLTKHKDDREDVEAIEFEGADILFTNDPSLLKESNFYIVAVPTPIDANKLPDLKPLLNATHTIGKVLKKGDYVVFESTVYPGCTEEQCVPILEKESGLKHLKDFKTGYSPERINPGDKEHSFTKITKVVSGCDSEALATITYTYQLVIQADIYKASSIKVAEAAKIIENTQRDLNIALMNELSIIFERMNINTYEVLEAAGTKWNFLNFSPGLVGGHCIGVDPYYLTYKAKQMNYMPEVILIGRHINDNMGDYVAKKMVHLLESQNVPITNAKVLVMGITFKENVQDIRNSKVADLVIALKLEKVNVDVWDPQANKEETLREYGFSLVDILQNDYDAIVLAVPHKEFLNKNEDYFRQFCPNGILADLKGHYRGKIKKLHYWSL